MFEHRFYYTPREYIAYYTNSSILSWDKDERFLHLKEDELNAAPLHVNLDNMLFYTVMAKKNDVVQSASSTP